MTSPIQVKEYTTREKGPQARPKYTCPAPVMRQFWKEKPVLSVAFCLFWAVTAPQLVCITFSSQFYTRQPFFSMRSSNSTLQVRIVVTVVNLRLIIHIFLKPSPINCVKHSCISSLKLPSPVQLISSYTWLAFN